MKKLLIVLVALLALVTFVSCDEASKSEGPADIYAFEMPNYAGVTQPRILINDKENGRCFYLAMNSAFDASESEGGPAVGKILLGWMELHTCDSFAELYRAENVKVYVSSEGEYYVNDNPRTPSDKEYTGAYSCTISPEGPIFILGSKACIYTESSDPGDSFNTVSKTCSGRVEDNTTTVYYNEGGGLDYTVPLYKFTFSGVKFFFGEERAPV